MRILIDIGHPAHVHLFRCFAKEMANRGHQLLFTCREKEFEASLLAHYGFDYVSFGKKPRSIAGKIWGLARFGIKEFTAGCRFRPDLLLSHGSMVAAHASFLLRKPHVSFEDTFNFEQVRLYLPFTDVVLTSDYAHPLESNKVVRYAGYHELAYLYPTRFVPDSSIIEELGVAADEKYVIMRFVSWAASHDRGHAGISPENKIRAVREFEKHARVFISSESALPPALEAFRLPVKPHRVHDAMAFSSLMFGESATMASEAAMLGVPAIYLDNTGRLYTNELEQKYGLCHCYTENESDQKIAIEKGKEILQVAGRPDEWPRRRDRMLAEKIDVTAFLVWFVENYPTSKEIMKKTPDFQGRFRCSGTHAHFRL